MSNIFAKILGFNPLKKNIYIYIFEQSDEIFKLKQYFAIR